MHELAESALDALARDAITDGYANGVHNPHPDIMATVDMLRTAISTRDGQRGINPRYMPFPEMAEAMLTLAAVAPEEHAVLFEGIGRTDARTYHGFLYLAGVIQSLGDDHDYAIDLTDAAKPRLIMSDARTEFVTGASPAGVVEALSPLLAELSIGANASPGR